MIHAGNFFRFSGFQTETVAYFTALGILNDTTIYYTGTPQEKTGTQLFEIVDAYIVAMKNSGIWNKIQLDYPFIGGTATRHSYNLKNTSQFQQVFFGGWVHNELGAKPNGVDAFSDSGFIPSVNQNVNSNGLTYVSGTNLAETSGDPVNIGSYDYSYGSLIVVTQNQIATRMNGNLLSTANSDNKGVFTSQRVSVNDTKIYKNTNLLITGNSGGVELSPLSLFLASLNLVGFVYVGGYTLNRFQSAFAHEGLTDLEVATFHSIINTRELALNRKTW